jgi:hypothetical protein
MSLLDPLLFFLGTILSVAVSISWARRSLEHGAAAALCAGSVTWVALIVIPQLALSALGALNSLTEHALVTLLSALLFFWLSRGRPRPDEAQDPLQSRWRGDWGLCLLGAALLLVPLGQELARSLARAPWDGDSLLYHLPLLLDTYLRGHIFSLAPPFGHSPPYAELAGGWWWNERWHDALMALQNPLAFLLLAGALVRICQRLEIRGGIAWLSVGLFFETARAIQRQSTTQETDLWLAALVLAGFAWCLGPLAHRRERIMAGLALGLAMGCKHLGPVFVVIVLGCALLAQLKQEAAGPSVVRRFAPVAGLALAVGAVPFLRNWFLTGNPFYPGRVAIFGVTLFGASTHSTLYGIDDFTSVWPYLRASGHARWLYLHAIRDHLGVLPLLGTALFPVAVLSRRRLRVQWALGLCILATLGILWTIPAYLKDPAGQTPDWLLEGYSLARFGLVPFGLLVVFVALGLDLLVEKLAGHRAFASTLEHRPRSRYGGVMSSLATGLLLATLSITVALHPALQAAREDSRRARLRELTGCSPEDLKEWDSLNLKLSHRELVVHGVYPWYLAGRDFSNYLRKPDSSRVPLARAQIAGAPRTLVYFETPKSAARLPGVLKELGIPPTTPATENLGRFKLWNF